MSRALIESLYADVFSRTSAPEMLEQLNAKLAPGWESIGDYAGAKKTRDSSARNCAASVG
jgi:hypothetical protein